MCERPLCLYFCLSSPHLPHATKKNCILHNGHAATDRCKHLPCEGVFGVNWFNRPFYCKNLRWVWIWSTALLFCIEGVEWQHTCSATTSRHLRHPLFPRLSSSTSSPSLSSASVKWGKKSNEEKVRGGGGNVSFRRPRFLFVSTNYRSLLLRRLSIKAICSTWKVKRRFWVGVNIPELLRWQVQDL